MEIQGYGEMGRRIVMIWHYWSDAFQAAGDLVMVIRI